MVEAQAKIEPNAVMGIVWMVVTGILFVTFTAIVKYVGTDLPTAQTAFLRYAFGLVFLLPMVRSLLRAQISPRAWGMFAARGAMHAIGVSLWFFAMTQIPMAEVTAINYLTPVVVTIGAAYFLGERLSLPRILAIGVALAGAMLILRPGFREVMPGHLAMLGTALFLGVSYLLAKPLSDECEPVLVVAMLSLVVTIALTPFAVYHWITPTWEQLGWLFLVACLATLGHLTMTMAFRVAPLNVTQPVNFLQLVWSVAIGLVIFHEAVDIWVIIGGTTILGAVSYITWREAMNKRRIITPPAVATKL